MADTEDSKELQDLFDQNVSGSGPDKNDVFDDIGKLTRQLHQALHELGLDRTLSSAANSIPDARDRLKYVADLTEKAADRVLTATEKIQPLNDTLGEQAKTFQDRWNTILTRDVEIEEFTKLVYDTQSHFTQMAEVSNIMREQFMEIIMAQDFQDLTGQMIKKLTVLTTDLETKLLEVLIEHAPNERPELITDLGGPTYTEKAIESVSNQAEVDSLLESLGF